MKNVKIKKEVKKYLGYIHPGNEIIEVCGIESGVKDHYLLGNKPLMGDEIIVACVKDHKTAANLVIKLNKVEPEWDLYYIISIQELAQRNCG